MKSPKRKARSKPKAGKVIRKTWPDIYWPVEWITLKEAKKRGRQMSRESFDDPPKTPYGLALDLAWDIVQRDDEANKCESRSLRPGLTDEYTLAKHFLIAQEYITTLKNDLEEEEMNCKANAQDAANLRDGRRKLLQICEAVALGYENVKADETLKVTARKLYESLTMLPL